MRITALALADEPRRFVSGGNPRGARLLLTPNIEISRLAALVTGIDHLRYLDERVCTIDLDGTEDLILAHVPLAAERSARRVADHLRNTNIPLLFFGPAVTAMPEPAPPWMRHRVIGDLLNVWEQVRTDVLSGSLADTYRADRMPIHSVMA
ncbi:MAG: hypothetical protein ABIK43_06890, partial [candidate division WOR-3 bacterium]